MTSGHLSINRTMNFGLHCTPSLSAVDLKSANSSSTSTSYQHHSLTTAPLPPLPALCSVFFSVFFRQLFIFLLLLPLLSFLHLSHFVTHPGTPQSTSHISDPPRLFLGLVKK